MCGILYGIQLHGLQLDTLKQSQKKNKKKPEDKDTIRHWLKQQPQTEYFQYN